MKKVENSTKNMAVPFMVVALLFAMFGFVTFATGGLNGILEETFNLTKGGWQSQLVFFAFFFACLVSANASSWVVNRVGYKKGMSVGIAIIGLGSFLFVPAALYKSFLFFLGALFVTGVGNTLTQTAVNPYITILGPIDSAARRISFMGIMNKFAGGLAPVILASAIAFAPTATQNEKLAQISTTYWWITAVFAVAAILMLLVKMPELSQGEKSADKANDKPTGKLTDYPHLLLGVVTLFLYVGIETMVMGQSKVIGEAYGMTMEHTKFYNALGSYGLIVGYIIGIIFIPKYLSQSKALALVAGSGILLSIVGMLVPASTVVSFPFVNLVGFESTQLVIPVKVLLFAAMGFSCSLVWPAVWPLAMDGLGSYIKSAAGWMMLAVVGGAVYPVLWGIFNESGYPGSAFILGLISFAMIFFYGTVGYKMRRAKTSTPEIAHEKVC